ncbi:hypothetical protein ACFYS8_36285 [Kitasatospora sp. NPDC004615]|uniref:hypothetical protein n=1 Tax=Kitasatospora sp. NPDC004615 TaxID=3364017 RepID=UPI00369209B8
MSVVVGWCMDYMAPRRSSDSAQLYLDHPDEGVRWLAQVYLAGRDQMDRVCALGERWADGSDPAAEPFGLELFAAVNDEDQAVADESEREESAAAGAAGR